MLGHHAVSHLPPKQRHKKISKLVPGILSLPVALDWPLGTTLAKLSSAPAIDGCCFGQVDGCGAWVKLSKSRAWYRWFFSTLPLDVSCCIGQFDKMPLVGVWGRHVDVLWYVSAVLGNVEDSWVTTQCLPISKAHLVTTV